MRFYEACGFVVRRNLPGHYRVPMVVLEPKTLQHEENKQLQQDAPGRTTPLRTLKVPASILVMDGVVLECSAENFARQVPHNQKLQVLLGSGFSVSVVGLTADDCKEKNKGARRE